MEKKIETTVISILQFYVGNNGQENGNDYSILGLYVRNNGKENGNYCIILGIVLGNYL